MAHTKVIAIEERIYERLKALSAARASSVAGVASTLLGIVFESADEAFMAQVQFPAKAPPGRPKGSKKPKPKPEVLEAEAAEPNGAAEGGEVSNG